jgi:hypothetical protein
MLLLERNKICTDIRLKSIASGEGQPTHSEDMPEINSQFMISSQKKIVFHGSEWIKPSLVSKALDRHLIVDAPISQIDLLLPSTVDGEKHRTTFALINTHNPMFRKMAEKDDVPLQRLYKIHHEFRLDMEKALSKTLFKFLKFSLLLMVDVNPGKEEMFDKSFVNGLKQPFMHRIVGTKTFWEFTDYEVW